MTYSSFGEEELSNFCYRLIFFNEVGAFMIISKGISTMLVFPRPSLFLIKEKKKAALLLICTCLSHARGEEGVFFLPNSIECSDLKVTHIQAKNPRTVFIRPISFSIGQDH